MATGTLTINLGAIASNWQALDRRSDVAVETGACVKADAYGLGVDQVAPALAAAGVKTFFVAVAEEGAALRQILGPEANILIFSGHMATDTSLLAEHWLVPMLNTPEQVEWHFGTLPDRPFGIQLDTGMNRLGLEADEWAAVRETVLAANPALVMSHLACADEPRHPMNARQLRAFSAMTQGVEAKRSLAATGGILLGPDYHFDLTRPGIGIYGGEPFDDADAVARLSVPVIQTRDVQNGETVGYGNSWTAERDSRIATIAAGYADGLIRAMSGTAQVFAGDTICPVVGRVSMDLITVDVTDLDQVPRTLDLLGPEQTVDQLAATAGTIGYEILTSLGARYARRYEAGE